MTTTIMRHPDPATLMGFAAGSLAEPLAAVVAAHLDMCEACRAEVADLELLGAVLMADAEAPREDAATAVVPGRPIDRATEDVVRHADPSGTNVPRCTCSAKIRCRTFSTIDHAPEAVGELQRAFEVTRQFAQLTCWIPAWQHEHDRTAFDIMTLDLSLGERDGVELLGPIAV